MLGGHAAGRMLGGMLAHAARRLLPATGSDRCTNIRRSCTNGKDTPQLVDGQTGKQIGDSVLGSCFAAKRCYVFLVEYRDCAGQLEREIQRLLEEMRQAVGSCVYGRNTLWDTWRNGGRGASVKVKCPFSIVGVMFGSFLLDAVPSA
jgi:hypothetical protein